MLLGELFIVDVVIKGIKTKSRGFGKSKEVDIQTIKKKVEK